jgi:hypothetical protein
MFRDTGEMCLNSSRAGDVDSGPGKLTLFGALEE